MGKKLIVSVVPLLAAVAFAMAPAAAPASTGHWIVEGAPVPTGSPGLPVTEWGKLKLESVAGNLECYNAIGGYLENPASGGAGVAYTEAFGTWGCVANYTCPTGTRPGAAPSLLPWIGTLESIGGTPQKFRAVGSRTLGAGGVRAIIGCTFPAFPASKAEITEGTPFIVGPATTNPEGTKPLAPAANHKGTGAKNPGFFEFDVGSGKLEAEGSTGAVLGSTEGKVKVLGFEPPAGDEHVWAE